MNATLRWCEARAGANVGMRLSDTDIFQWNLAQVQVDAEQDTMVRKSPRFLTILVMALEMGVGDAEVPRAYRVFMWARLLKVYGVLRSDDLQRLDPGRVQMRESGLSAKLSWTKTTGAGKKVRGLVLPIPVSAWLVFPGWLAEGSVSGCCWRRG